VTRLAISPETASNRDERSIDNKEDLEIDNLYKKLRVIKPDPYKLEELQR
jgi:hypothetical protein